MSKRRILILTIVFVLMSTLIVTGCSSERKLDIDPLLIEIGKNVYNEIEFINMLEEEYDNFPLKDIQKILDNSDIAIDSIEEIEKRAKTEDEKEFFDNLYDSYLTGLNLTNAHLEVGAVEKRKFRATIFKDEYKDLEPYHDFYN